MIRPRNTLVLVKLIESATRTVGQIVQTTNRDMFTQATVLAVGPGNIAAEGGVSDTFDLHPGQIVTVLYKESRRGPVGEELKNVGVPVTLEDGSSAFLYEQNRIVTIDEELIREDAGRAGRIIN